MSEISLCAETLSMIEGTRARAVFSIETRYPACPSK